MKQKYVSNVQRALDHKQYVDKERKSMKIDKSKVIWDATSAQAEALRDKHVIGFTKYDGCDAVYGVLTRIEPTKGNTLLYHFQVRSSDGCTTKFRFIIPDESQLELVDVTKQASCTPVKQEPDTIGVWKPQYGELVVITSYVSSSKPFIRIFVANNGNTVQVVAPKDMHRFMGGLVFDIVEYADVTMEKINGTNLAPAPKKRIPFDFESFQPYREKWVHEKGMSILCRIETFSDTGVYIAYVHREIEFLTYGALEQNWLFDDETPCNREVV